MIYMTIAELTKKLNQGLTINEIINSDLNLIGHNDDVDSVEDVSADGTTDDFIKTTRQRGGVDRTNSIYALDMGNTLLEENEEDTEDLLNKNYPVIGRNLDVLIDSLHRRDTTPEVYEMVIKKLINNVKWDNMSSDLRQFVLNKLGI